MSFHLRQINKLPKPRENIKKFSNYNNKFDRINTKLTNKTKSQMDISTSTLNSNNMINSKNNFIEKILDKNNQLKLNNLFNQYLHEYISIDKLVKTVIKYIKSTKSTISSKFRFDFK